MTKYQIIRIPIAIVGFVLSFPLLGLTFGFLGILPFACTVILIGKLLLSLLQWQWDEDIEDCFLFATWFIWGPVGIWYEYYLTGVFKLEEREYE